jgi:RNase H-fold protein (predicted Holliday junction resolvase)
MIEADLTRAKRAKAVDAAAAAYMLQAALDATAHRTGAGWSNEGESA